MTQTNCHNGCCANENYHAFVACRLFGTKNIRFVEYSCLKESLARYAKGRQIYDRPDVPLDGGTTSEMPEV